jgi:uncharacterized protein
MDWHYSLSGLLVGALVGVTGVGGGSLMTPILVLVFGIHPATAVGTDLLYAAITKSVGVAVHGRNRMIDWRIVGRLAAGSLPAALITLYLISHTDRNSIFMAGVITATLGITLMATSFLLFFRGRQQALTRHFQFRHQAMFSEDRALPTIVLGAILGILVTLTSVGAGAIGVSLMLFLYPQLNLKKIIGSDIAHAVPLTLISGAGYWMIGAVDWRMLVSLLSGSIPGIIIGSMLASRAPDRLIRLTLAAILAVVGLKLLIS